MVPLPFLLKNRGSEVVFAALAETVGVGVGRVVAVGLLTVVELIGYYDRGCSVAYALDWHFLKHINALAVVAEDRPSVSTPFQRDENRHTAYCALVLEEHGIPLSVRGVEDIALCHTAALLEGRAVLILHLANEYFLHLPWLTEESLASPAYLLTPSLAVAALNHEDIVVVADFIAVVALGTKSLNRIVGLSV